MALQMGGGSPTGAGAGSIGLTYKKPDGTTGTTSVGSTLPPPGTIPAGSVIDPTKTTTFQTGPTPGTVQINGGAPQPGPLPQAPPPAAPRPMPSVTDHAMGKIPTAAPAAPAPPGEGYGPGFGEQYGKDHIGNYDQPTAMEQFFQSQMTGDNPYYQRLQQQQADGINQQMAARGHYNSGGAMAALGNASGALYADQFANMGNMAAQASNLAMNRYGQGFQQAQGVQNQQQNRINSQFGQAGQLAALGAGTYGGFYGQGGSLSGDAAMSGINAGANAAQLTGQGQGAMVNTARDGLKAWLQY